MKECQLNFTEPETEELFKFFDEDAGGTITYDEFLVGIRGEMNTRRSQLVLLAFDILDADKGGFVDIDDIADKYNAKTNPDVISGKKTEKQVLKEFLDTFDQGEKDGKVYPDEFCKYYSNISASVDLDDYFELMIRNAWHIPGGEGWCANTANKRVLVIDPETGEERIECVENDLGMDASDPAAIKARLAQNKKKGGSGGAAGPQVNKNATAKLGGSSISFGGDPTPKPKKKPSSRMGESSLKLAEGYGPATPITVVLVCHIAALPWQSGDYRPLMTRPVCTCAQAAGPAERPIPWYLSSHGTARTTSRVLAKATTSKRTLTRRRQLEPKWPWLSLLPTNK